jgi:hypothetical protein
VEALSGAVGTIAELSTWLTDGATDVVRRIGKIQRDLLWRFTAASSSFTTGGFSGSNALEVLDVQRGSWPAYEIPAAFRQQAVEATSIHKCTAKRPCFYKLNDVIYVKPDPATGALGYASYIAPFTVAYGDSAIAGFPDELEYLVVLYGAVENTKAKLADLVVPTSLAAGTSAGLIPETFEVEYDKASTHLDTNEDPELAQIKIEQVKLLLAGYAHDKSLYDSQAAVLQARLVALTKQYEDGFVPFKVARSANVQS